MQKIKINKLLNKAKLKLIQKYNFLLYKVNKLRKRNINNLVWYSIIWFVWTLVIIVNMNEYMNYITVKYSIKSYIPTSYWYTVNDLNNESSKSDTINFPDTKDISEEIELNSAKEIENQFSKRVVILSHIYKNNLIKTYWESLYNIEDNKKDQIAFKINETIDKINNIDSNSINKANSLAKLIALKELLENSKFWIDKSNVWKMTTWWWEVDNINIVQENKIEKNINNLDSNNNSNTILSNIDYNIKNDINNSLSPTNVSLPSNSIINTQKQTTQNTIQPTKNSVTTTNTQKVVTQNTTTIQKQTTSTNTNNTTNTNTTTQKQITQNTNTTQSTATIVTPKVVEPIKIVNTNSDSVSIAINKEIENKLNKLNAGIFNWFKIKLLKDNNLVLENWVWYTYVFTKYQWYGKWVVPDESDLIDWWISKETTLLVLDDANWATFVKDYKKVKLISDSIISNISNKQTFLSELADDKKYLQEDTDTLFTQLKNETITLTSGAGENTKIQKIYDYILRNVSYAKFDINNKYIFSWIYTYKNKTWVCTWYAKLDLYMLSFAWVSNARVIRWTVIDAPDFPNIWHAWLQVWYSYYDPTFDDPSNRSSVRTQSEYKYFWLPKDLFYTNRFNYGTLPEYLKSASIDDRKNYVTTEISKLQDKYTWSDYNLLKQ